MIVYLGIRVARTVHEDLDLVILCEHEVVEVPAYRKPHLLHLVLHLHYLLIMVSENLIH